MGSACDKVIQNITNSLEATEVHLEEFSFNDEMVFRFRRRSFPCPAFMRGTPWMKMRWLSSL